MSQDRAPHVVPAGDPAARARLTVVPRLGQRPRRLPFAVLVAVLLLGGVVGLLLFNTSMQQASFAATALEAQATVLHAQEQSLRMELDQLRDPQRVALRAQELGMVPIANPAFLSLGGGPARDTRTLGHPVPVTGADGQRLAPLPTRRPKSFRPEPNVVPWDAARAPSGAAATAGGARAGTKTAATR